MRIHIDLCRSFFSMSLGECVNEHGNLFKNTIQIHRINNAKNMFTIEKCSMKIKNFILTQNVYIIISKNNRMHNEIIST